MIPLHSCDSCVKALTPFTITHVRIQLLQLLSACAWEVGEEGEKCTLWVGLSLLQEEPLKEVGSQHAGCGLVLSSLFRGSQNWEGCRDLPTSDITCCTYGWWVRKEGQTVRKSLLYVCTYARISVTFLVERCVGRERPIEKLPAVQS